ncbi:MAG: 50S ribosomal protein L17 [Candidatus Woesebacteria bacterium GW2011_GWB1_40_101]|uniref:50S ribosomal protein L17 n=1 Tax=Candidatus Woesebacteria bacterium GW2011_GWB1_40_101 TaxID=1618575 RepID=A0A0G0QGB1_9BACT|nr:MAG: 50S ribosomal protein L17 [Candidatus Woesebacteria bacterium GW2011_GWB1_40_101]
MRKMVFGRKFSRGQKGRRALFRSLIRALVFYGKITTTKAKAKAIQGDVDKVISLAKEGSLSAQRRILSELANDRDSLEILFNKVAPAFKERTSGFTRIIMLPRRKGDNAEMVRIEWSQEIIDKKSKVKKAKAKEKKVKAKPKKK